MTKSRLGWIVMALVLGGALGQARAVTPWTAVLVQEALAGGFQATLPPHVAVVLGLAAHGESVAVRQLVERTDHTVRTFNVSAAHPRDMVMFRVDEGARAAVAYLVAPGGKLRQALSYHSGGEPQLLTEAEAHDGFVREVRYWSRRARQSAPEPAR